MSAQRPSAACLLRRLEATPAEVAALAVLAVGALLALGLLWWLQRPADVVGPRGLADGAVVSDAPSELAVSTGEVVVHVAGAVRNPDVFTLPGGSRLGEAVAAAGGPTKRGVLDGLNLARVLTDGEQVLVPDRRTGTATPAGGAEVESAAEQKVNLNTATAAEFETLPGIGPVLASMVLEYRDSIGGFTEIGQLRDVPGIGEKTFQALVDSVSL